MRVRASASKAPGNALQLFLDFKVKLIQNCACFKGSRFFGLGPCFRPLPPGLSHLQTERLPNGSDPIALFRLKRSRFTPNAP